MKIKTVIFFVLAVAVSLVAAGHRFYDSSHSMGLIGAAGGKVLHPVVLEGGRNSYTVIATATVLPLYRGDARIVLEGNPQMTYSLHNSGPIIDLGLHRHPRFENNVFYGLQPRDRLALWLVMKPARGSKPTGPGTTGSAASNTVSAGGHASCPLHEETSEPNPIDRGGREKLALTFYDTRTNQPVLRIPVIFKAKGKGKHGSEQH
jgi:hypothetical protein